MDDNLSRQEIRALLIKQGYLPLPLLDKGIRIKGWVNAEIDLEWIQQYDRNGRFLNTGIRCDSLAAIDIDVLDEALADQIEALVEERLGATDLCRVGRWPKRLLLYRIAGDPAEKSARTGKFGEHMVELLCSRGRQFAAFGKHPDTEKDYEWCDGVSPLNVPISDLPTVKYEAAYALLEEIEALFIAAGLERTAPGGQRGIGGSNEYDLCSDTEVMVDGEVVRWGELRETLDDRGVFGNLWRSEINSWGDSNGVHFYRARGSGEPCAFDFPRDCTHWDAVVGSDLPEVLPDRGGDDGVFTPPELQTLLDEWVHMTDGTIRNIVDPLHHYDLGKFHQFMANVTVPIPGKNGKFKQEIVSKVWQVDANKKVARRAVMRPETTDVLVPLADGSDITIFNTYRPPVHPETGGSIDVVMEFIEYLIPAVFERSLFLDWHALKMAHPEWRLHGFVMVTKTFGTGRGTWSHIVGDLLGEDYVQEITLDTLIGTGSQAQYTDWMGDSLVVTVPEAYTDLDSSKWKARRNAYERIKSVCDPTSSRTLIKRKYGRNAASQVYTSLLISSNHVDALAIDPDDRRLIVIDNTEIPLAKAPGDLQTRIHAWRTDRSNIGALHRWLLERAKCVDYDPVGMPPITDAKQRMIDSGQSDLDLAFDWMIEHAAGDLVTHHQWRRFALQAKEELALEWDALSSFENGLKAVLKLRGEKVDNGTQTGVIKISSNVVRPWAIRKLSRWTKGANNRDIRCELSKNGEVGGQLLKIH